jgi:polyisoprenoid-binding protein YceI
MTMHGVTKLMTFNVEYGGEVTDPAGATKTGFTAKGKLSRKDFGLTWNKTLDKGGLALGEDVEIEVEVEGKKL